MRRPLPPELIALGDQLESAANRALARRRARRQQTLNAITGLVVAVPLAVALATAEVTTSAVPAPVATPTSEPVTTMDLRDSALIGEVEDAGETLAIPDDFLPRVLRRDRQASPEMLVLPSSLRPALR